MGNKNDHPSSLLLVEGNDDFHVIHALCKLHNIQVRNLENPDGGKFSVRDSKGYDNLINLIQLNLKNNINKNYTLGIIVDADTDLQSRWTAIQNLISEFGFNPPENIPDTGLILQYQNLKFGAWIMPDNNLNGMLEDFIRFLVPQDDKLLSTAYSTLESIEEENLNKYSSVHKSKALIHTWLAWQESPGTPLGQSITKRYLTTENESCTKFITWLNTLFIN